MATKPGKRLIVGCDGTWLDRDSDLGITGKIPVASNVARILRATEPVTHDNIPQVIYYQSGVGSVGGLADRIIDGATAGGLAANIREAYDWVSSNYSQSAGDEVFLIGFSRGAFTVRSIGGMIGTLGLLTKTGLPYLAEIFEDFEHRLDKDYKPALPDIPFPNKPSVSDPAYAQELQRASIGVWDTVGALGIPRVPFLETVGLQPALIKSYQFYDTSLEDCIENAFQALALDEKRSAYKPTIWEKLPGNKTTLKQAWFPGVHKNVGGGYPDQELANITLAWMMDQLSSLIQFSPHYITQQYEENEKNYLAMKEKDRPWSFGSMPDTSAGVRKLLGTTPRTPGQYKRVDDKTGEETKTPMRDTNEHVHPSVRTRVKLGGPGVADKGLYVPAALDGFECVNHGGAWQWEKRSLDGNEEDVILREDSIGESEMTLLRKSERMFDFLEGGRGAEGPVESQ